MEIRRVVIAYCIMSVLAVLCLAQTSRVAQVLSQIAPAVRAKSAVPLRFPTQIPQLDNEPDLHGIVRSATSTEYLVVLGATPDCEGQHVCSYGALIGTAQPLEGLDFYELADRKRIPVQLIRGLKGNFYEGTCGAYCGDSLIVWTEANYHYVIGLKSGNKSELVAVANSAIKAGSGWK